MKPRMLRFAPFVALFISGFAFAQNADAPDPVVRVTLDSGDTLRGVFVSRSEEEVVFLHPVLGRVAVPMANVVAMEMLPPDAAAAPVTPAPAGSGDPAEAGGVATPVPDPDKDKPKWTGEFEFGASGSEGNTDRTNIRAGFGAERKEEFEILSLSATYRLGYESGDKNENRLQLSARQEWLIPDSRWSYFVQSSLDVDEFKDYDARLAAAAGFGYRFIETDETTLVGRIGLGGSYEFGGAEEIVPEGLLGVDFRHRLNDRVDFTANATYFPDLSELGEFRLIAESALDVSLQEQGKLMLRLGVRDEYDSHVTNAEKNDFYYFASLVYKF